MKPKSPWMTRKEVEEFTGYKATKAGALVKKLNDELAAKGYLIIRGKVSRKYFMERMVY